jgi:hypothetical protein
MGSWLDPLQSTGSSDFVRSAELSLHSPNTPDTARRTIRRVDFRALDKNEVEQAARKGKEIILDRELLRQAFILDEDFDRVRWYICFPRASLSPA